VLPLFVLRTPAILDVQVHPFLALDRRLGGVIGALEILALLRLEHGEVLGPIGRVIGSLLSNPLSLGLVLSMRQARTAPTAEQPQASRTGAIDVPGRLLGGLSTMGAGEFHGPVLSFPAIAHAVFCDAKQTDAPRYDPVTLWGTSPYWASLLC
jgi:hypothetical protein